MKQRTEGREKRSKLWSAHRGPVPGALFPQLVFSPLHVTLLTFWPVAALIQTQMAALTNQQQFSGGGEGVSGSGKDGRAVNGRFGHECGQGK